VLTHDGFDGSEPHWVDRAPGGTTPDGTEVGADYVVGSCGGAGGAGGGSGGAGGGAGGAGGSVAGSGGGGGRTTSVLLGAPARLVGGGTAQVRGSIVPPRGGVPVDLTVTGRSSLFRRAVTRPDGTFSVSLPIGETTRVRAVAEGIGSQTKTVLVRSTVRIRMRKLRGGGVRVTGAVKPALPGRVLLVRTTSPTPSARKTLTRGSRFTFRLKKPRPGRYQAVFIPSRGRAERSTSNTGAIR
jgi:hypothetical protein